MSERVIIQLLEKLSQKERRALTAAVTALHFKDEEEYMAALFAVIIAIVGEDITGSVAIEDLLAVLDPYMLEEN